jgi:hypothetical protein
MDHGWYERLQIWKEGSERELKKKWYLWPIGFAVDLLWHRICGGTNDFLDSHGATMLTTLTSRIPSDPVTLSVITALLIVLGLLIHAYYDTRKRSDAQVDESRGTGVAVAVPFHPSLSSLGRHIESAVYGSVRKAPDDVTRKIRSLAAMGTNDIPVNHFEICDNNHDPDPGEDKFLTVSLSDTVRQGGRLELPIEWLRGGASIPENVEIKDAPRVRVDHIKADITKARIEQLVIKNDSKSPAIIRRIGALISREKYQTEFSFNMSPSVLPAVDNDKPIECTLYGMIDPDGQAASLGDLLNGGNPLSMDSVVIDYDDDNENEFSRQFVLTRNGDGTVAWTPDPIVVRGNTRSLEPGTLNLADLRQKLALAIAYPKEHQAAQQFAGQLQEAQRENGKLINARKGVEIAGAFRLLADEADELCKTLRGIRVVLDKDLDKEEVVASEYPLREMPFDRREDRLSWTHTHVKMLLFQHDYAWHRSYVLRERLDTGFTSDVTKYPLSSDDSNTAERVVEILDLHAKELRAHAAKLTQLP